MNLFHRISRMVSLLAAFAVLVACGGGSAQPTVPAPVGAATGLNTFIFVYSDN